jgi:hypothetical protein
LPAHARHDFFDTYGSVPSRVTAAARLRALTSAIAQEAYGHDVGDIQIEREGVLALHSVVAR